MAVVTPKRLVADLRDAAMDGQALLRRLQRDAVTGELTAAQTGDVAGTMAALFRHWTGLLDAAADQMRAADAQTGVGRPVMAATIARVVDTGAGVSDGEAQRPPDSASEWLETVGRRQYAVRYARPGGWQWAGTWISPDGIPVTTYGLTLEMCQVRLRLEIGAREVRPCE